MDRLLIIHKIEPLRSNPSLTLIGKFLGNFWDRFTGKLIHQKIMSMYSVFFKNRVVSKTVSLENSSNHQLENSWASHRPFYWKTHPDQMLHIIYGFSQKIWMDEFSSKTKLNDLWYSWFLMDKFSSKTPHNWNFEKNGWVFQ